MEEKVGWIEIELGQVCDVIRGASPRPMGDPRYFAGDIPFIKIGDITKISGKTIFDSEIHVNEEGAKKSRLLKKGSLILSNSGTVCIPKFLGIDSCIHDGFVAFNNMPDFVSQTFLFHYFHYMRPYVIQKHKQGVTQVNLNTTIVKEFEISLPPLPEQRAIVSKIEQLFSELDNGIDNLKLAQEQLKVYRQAVLKKAFEGELTKKWREQQTDLPDAKDLLEQIRREREEDAKISGKKVKPLNPLTEVELDELPKLLEKWKWVKIGDVSNCLDSQRIPVNKSERMKRTGNIPYYGANGQVGLIDDYLFDKTLVLVVEDETFTGREKPFSYLITGKSWVNNHAHVLQATSGLDIDFLNYQLSYYPFTRLTTGTTGRKKLTQLALINAPFKICSLPEQQAIVQEIETRLSVCDKIEQDIKDNLEKAEALRQSILKKAFEGKLLNEKELAEVREAEDWEPAEVLLERVKAEKTASGKKDRS